MSDAPPSQEHEPLRRLRPAVVDALVALTPLFQRQFGVFTAEQAVAAGMLRQRLHDLGRAGLITRLYRGVHMATQYPSSWEAMWMAALLAAGPDAVVSGSAAAFLHGLTHAEVSSRPPVEITIPRGARFRTSGPKVVTERHLTADDIVAKGPWRLTSVAWTLCSLAHGLGVEQLERALDAAVAAGKTTTALAGEAATRFRYCTGMPVIREVLQRHDPAVRLTRSEAERLFLRVLRAAGLPLPEANVRVFDDHGNRRYLDFAYEEYRIMIEIDVFGEHLRTIGRHHDGRRQNALVSDWRPLRFDELDLRYAPERVVDDVRRALRAAGAEV